LQIPSRESEQKTDRRNRDKWWTIS
jgi:hypothetical protein